MALGSGSLCSLRCLLFREIEPLVPSPYRRPPACLKKATPRSITGQRKSRVTTLFNGQKFDPHRLIILSKYDPHRPMILPLNDFANPNLCPVSKPDPHRLIILSKHDPHRPMILPLNDFANPRLCSVSKHDPHCSGVEIQSEFQIQ